MSDRALRVAVAVLALAGAAIAGYLTWAHYEDEAVACPIGGGGCETVQQSSYAELAGIPVALLGLVLYVVVLALVAWDAPPARQAVAVLALAGTAFALYLVAIQLWVIDAVCTWCMANDVVIVLLAAASTARLLRSSAPDGAPAVRSGRGSPTGSRRSR
jgi:uncharacterized membrane protein